MLILNRHCEVLLLICSKRKYRPWNWMRRSSVITTRYCSGKNFRLWCWAQGVCSVWYQTSKWNKQTAYFLTTYSVIASNLCVHNETGLERLSYLSGLRIETTLRLLSRPIHIDRAVKNTNVFM